MGVAVLVALAMILGGLWMAAYNSGIFRENVFRNPDLATEAHAQRGCGFTLAIIGALILLGVLVQAGVLK